MSNLTEQIQKKIHLGDDAFNEVKYDTALEYYLDAAFHVVTVMGYIPVRQKIRSLISADIDGDGNDEILYGTEGYMVFASKANGDELWRFSTGDWVTGIEYIKNNYGTKEIIVASDKVYFLNNKGKPTNVYEIPTHASSLKIYYSEKDSDSFIVVGDKNGCVTCYNFSFKILGTFQTESKRHIIDIAIGDFDGDGNIEIAAASEDRHVYIVDKQGKEIDRMSVNHWIINMDSLKLTVNKSRLYIGEFQGKTHIYKPKSQSGQSISLSSILDLKVEHFFDNDDKDKPQFVVGSSDRQLAIFDYSGNLLWSFESGLGQRAICVKTNKNGCSNLYVGTESGEIFSYSIQLIPNLVQKIRETYNNLNASDLMDIDIDAEKLKVLRNFITYNPIKAEASLEQSLIHKNKNSIHDSIISAMEVWWNDCEYLWEYKTKGRVYDIMLSNFQHNDEQLILAGSADGILYCVDYNKNEKWFFHSVFGYPGEIRGVFADRYSAKSIIVASADKSLYMLDCNGVPQWNFQHVDSMMFTCSGYSRDKKRLIFCGTEDHKILTFDDDGLLLWERTVGERVRAMSFCDSYNGIPCVVVGSDDNYVYIFDCDGKEIHKFSTPHYVLVVHAQDIDGDGNIEILTGNENGHLHVYDIKGNLLWRFETGSWVAALDVLVNHETGETEIIIGSQDNHVYSLNKNGALLWQYETAARVRTLCVDSNTNKIAFGSYDNKFYLLNRTSRDTTTNFISNLYLELVQNNGTRTKQTYSKSISRHERAFSFLFEKEIKAISNAISDNSEIVLAAIGCNLSENFLDKNDGINLLIQVLEKSSRGTRAIILRKICSLINSGKIKKPTAYRVVCNLVRASKDTSSRIDAFRQWATIASDFCEVLNMAISFLPEDGKSIDEFVIDELNHACLIALKLPIQPDVRISDNIERIASQIENKYPKTVDLIRKASE